jgi:hypothetical protein
MPRQQTNTASTAKHLVTLERRRNYLEAQIAERAGSPKAIEYSTLELEALEAAEVALKLQRATLDALPEPLGLLREMVEHCATAGDSIPPKLRALSKRAGRVLEEFDP